MKITEEGSKIVISSEPWLIGKILAALFASMAVAFPVLAALSLVLPANHSSIDCDRSRGTCELSLGTLLGPRKRSVPIADIVKAEILHRPGRRNSSPSDTLVVTLRSGESAEVSQDSYHSNITSGFQAAEAGLNQFLASPSSATFNTTYVSSDYDWTYLVLFSLVMPPMAWLWLRLWVNRHVEIDRSTKTISSWVKRKLSREEHTTVDFSEVTDIQLRGPSWQQILLNTRNGELVVVVVPRWASSTQDVQEVVRQLSTTLNVPLNVGDADRAFWRLDR